MDKFTSNSNWAVITLFLVPLLILAFFGDAVIRNNFEKQKAAFSSNITTCLENLAICTDEILTVTQSLYEIETRKRRKIIKTDIDTLAYELTKAVPGIDFEMFVFDRSGKTIGISPNNAPNKWLMRQLIEGLSADEHTAAKMAPELDSRLKAIFGSSRTLSVFRHAKGKCLRVQRKHVPAIMFWEADENGGWLVIITSQPDINARMKAAWQNQAFPGRAFGCRENATGKWLILGPADAKTAEHFWKILERKGGHKIETVSRHWEFCSTSIGDILFLAAPRPKSLVKPPITMWWTIVLLVGLVGIYFLFTNTMALASISQLSVYLFLLAAGVPTTCAGIALIRMISDYQQLLVENVQRAQVGALRSFDERFDEFLEGFKRRLTAITSKENFYISLDNAQKLSKDFIYAPIYGRLELLGPDSRTLLRIPDETTAISEMLPHFQRIGMETLAPHLLSSPAIRLDANLGKMLRADKFGFTSLALRPRRMNQMNTSTNRPLIYWDYPRKAKPPITYASFVFSRETLMQRYLETHLLDTASLWGTKIRIAAHHNDRTESFPKNYVFWKKLLPALYKSRVLNKPTIGTVRIGRNEWSYTALLGSNLDCYGLIALFPNVKIEESLRYLCRQALAGTVIMLALAITLGVYLSKRLTKPISALADGVENLRKKRFDQKVPVFGRDELAHLANAFNDMTDELKELDMAHAIQSSLLPAEYPTLPEYSIYGASRFAGNLGGDYLDCRTMPDGCILLVVGDVSGHGAASALLTAFVKAAITLWLSNGGLDIAALVSKLDSLLRSFKGPRKFLSIFAGILDPKLNTLNYICCGHPYPIFIKEHGKADFIGYQAYPLGISKKQQLADYRKNQHDTPIRRYSMDFERGADLLLYTDGLIEALDAFGVQIGYERLMKNAVEICGAAPQDKKHAQFIIEKLLDFHEASAARIDDDVTLMVVSRLP